MRTDRRPEMPKKCRKCPLVPPIPGLQNVSKKSRGQSGKSSESLVGFWRILLDSLVQALGVVLLHLPSKIFRAISVDFYRYSLAQGPCHTKNTTVIVIHYGCSTHYDGSKKLWGSLKHLVFPPHKEKYYCDSELQIARELRLGSGMSLPVNLAAEFPSDLPPAI